ncbi:MAG: hypothetical protein ABIS01_11230 [Ferruginibacter sp.]
MVLETFVLFIKTDLAADTTETDNYSIIAEEAHIVANEENCQRAKSSLAIKHMKKIIDHFRPDNHSFNRG